MVSTFDAVPASLNLNLSLSITFTLYAEEITKPDIALPVEEYTTKSLSLKL